MKISRTRVRMRTGYEQETLEVHDHLEKALAILAQHLHDAKRIRLIIQGYEKGHNDAEISLISIAAMYGIELKGEIKCKYVEVEDLTKSKEVFKK